MKARAELLRRFGHEVISVTHNEAAKVALSSYHDVELFIVGHTAPEQRRNEMVAWLKANYPKVKIVALIHLRTNFSVRITTWSRMTMMSGCHFSPPQRVNSGHSSITSKSIRMEGSGHALRDSG